MALKGQKLSEEQKQKLRDGAAKARERRNQEKIARQSAVPASAAAAVGLPNAGLPAALSKPTDEYRIAHDPIELTEDEWDKKIRSTYNPFNEASEKYVNANPDLRFAFQSPRVQRVQGTREMTPVLDRDGKYVEVASQRLYYEPRRQFEAKEKRNLRRASEQAASPELSYREIQEQINRSRNDVGVQALSDGEFVKGGPAGKYGAGRVSTGRFGDDGKPLLDFSEGAAVIGVKTVQGVG